MVPFLESQLFHELRPYIVIQTYGRDGGPTKPRKRIELSRKTPRELVIKALNTMVACPACRGPMHPFRMRRGPGDKRGGDPQAIYFAAACPERPSEEQLHRWHHLGMYADVGDIQNMKSTLIEAANSFKTCCKGKAATDVYKAVIAAMEGG